MTTIAWPLNGPRLRCMVCHTVSARAGCSPAAKRRTSGGARSPDREAQRSGLGNAKLKSERSESFEAPG